MKEPIEHQAIESDYGPDDPVCAEDGDNWPCKTWRRWTASKDYRIAELEEGLKREQRRTSSLADQVRETAKTVREDSNILRNGIFHAMRDLGRRGAMGNLTLDWSRDSEDFDVFTLGRRVRVAGPTELTVTYEDLDGRTWTNGAVTDQTLRDG